MVLGAVEGVLQAAVAGGRPGLVLRAGFALVGGAVVGGSGLGAFVAGEVAGAPEGSCWRTLGQSAGGWRGCVRIAGSGVVAGRSWRSRAYLSSADGAVGLVGDDLTVFGLLAEVSSLGAVEQDERLINTILRVLLPHFIFSAFSAGLHHPIEKWLVLRAFDTGKRLHVPNRPFLGTAGVSA